MLWLRETETGQFDTPERRAALEARLGEVLATVGDKSVRKYYRQDFSDRLRRLLICGADIAAPPFEPTGPGPPGRARTAVAGPGALGGTRRFDRGWTPEPLVSGQRYEVTEPAIDGRPAPSWPQQRGSPP